MLFLRSLVLKEFLSKCNEGIKCNAGLDERLKLETSDVCICCGEKKQHKIINRDYYLCAKCYQRIYARIKPRGVQEGYCATD